MQPHPTTASLFADADTLALNQNGSLSADQVRRLGKTASLAGWLFSSLGGAAAIVIFVFGLLDGVMGAALHLHFQTMALIYALLAIFCVLCTFVVANGRTLANMAIGVSLSAAFCLVVLLLSHSVGDVFLCALLCVYLITLGTIGQMSQGGTRDTAPPKIVAVPLGILALLCLALWLIATVALLAFFMQRGYWVGPLVVFGLFFGLFVWAQSDEYFKGRAARHGAIVARSGEVAWEASKGAFVARVGKRTYHALGALPAVGLYRFYCMPSISYVVSAEPLPEVDLMIQAATSSASDVTLDVPAKKETAQGQAGRLVMMRSLMRSMRFRPSDLRANQRGRLSLRQSIRRGLPQLREVVVILYASALGGVLAGVLLAQIAPVANGFTALGAHVDVTGTAAMVLLVALTAAAFVALVASRPVAARARRMLSREVVVVDGEVTDTRIRGITDPSWSALISTATGRVLPPGTRYRFYIHKATGAIVSAVLLEL